MPPPSQARAIDRAESSTIEQIAMAELFALLSSGEDTAAAAFISLAQTWPDTEHALLDIAADEERHGKLVATMRATLPDIASDRLFVRRQKRFFYGLAEGALAARLAAIFALDSALCVLLSALRRSDATIVAPYLRTLAEIHRDEARHAAATLHWSRQLGDPAHNAAIIRQTRLGLVELLQDRSDAFADVGVSPTALFARLVQAPDA